MKSEGPPGVFRNRMKTQWGVGGNGVGVGVGVGGLDERMGDKKSLN